MNALFQAILHGGVVSFLLITPNSSALFPDKRQAFYLCEMQALTKASMDRDRSTQHQQA